MLATFQMHIFSTIGHKRGGNGETFPQISKAWAVVLMEWQLESEEWVSQRCLRALLGVIYMGRIVIWIIHGHSEKRTGYLGPGPPALPEEPTLFANALFYLHPSSTFIGKHHFSKPIGPGLECSRRTAAGVCKANTRPSGNAVYCSPIMSSINLSVELLQTR